jgi:phosphoribosylglycinamide formyltransferase-1
MAVLISGGGTTLQNFIDRIADGRFRATIAGVVASKPGIAGLDRATRAALPTTVVASGERLSECVFEAIRPWNVDLVCLAGWLKLLTIPDDFAGRVLNIHPSLLPAFGGAGMYGHRVHEAVLAAGVAESGCTVHFADNHYDTGPIVAQARVPVVPGDTPATLAARVFAAECDLYPAAIHHVWDAFSFRFHPSPGGPGTVNKS